MMQQYQGRVFVIIEKASHIQAAGVRTDCLFAVVDKSFNS